MKPTLSSLRQSAVSTAGDRRSPARRAVDHLRLPVVVGYAWVTMTLFGAIVLETVMIYPNIFAAPPQSLALTMEFFAVTGPSDVFPFFGLACWVFGATALLLTVRAGKAGWWIALSLGALIAEGAVSILYFWPRNEIMFIDGVAVHSAEYLRQVAREFETWHWLSRMVFNSVAALGAFIALLTVHRDRVLAGQRPRTPGSSM